MLKVEIEKEEDGRFVAEVPELPGAMVYGSTREPSTLSSRAYRLADLAPARITPCVRQGWASNFVFAFHDREEVGPRMLARIARHTGLRPEDL